MRTAQITLPALLSLSIKPLRKWLVAEQRKQVSRELDVVAWHQAQLREEERRLHVKDVQLGMKEMQIERGL